MSGNDVFIALSTGYGKSLWFDVLPRAFDLFRGVQNQSLFIDMSSLVALMRDQAASFASKGVTTVCISDEDYIRLRYVIIIFRWHNSFYGRCPDPALHVRGWSAIGIGELAGVVVRIYIS